MKKLLSLLMIIGIMAFSPIVYAEEIEEEVQVNIEKITVNYVQVDDSESIKLRSKDNELLSIKLLGISVPSDMEEATYNYLKDIFKRAGTIQIEYDDKSEETDSYGKRYAWVYVDDVLLQQLLVQGGYADIYSRGAEYRYMEELISDVNEAKENMVGIWAPKEVSNEEVVEEETKEEEKSIFKKITTSVIGFVDGILESILKMIESML